MAFSVQTTVQRALLRTSRQLLPPSTTVTSPASSSVATYATAAAKEANREQNDYDLAIVGGGIVGAATAYKISQMGGAKPLRIVILEKEKEMAMHQTGRNSGVIHSGIYYRPGSLKAALCVQGLDLMYEYCDKYSIPYKKVGKLIVAVDDGEVPGLMNLLKNGTANKVRDLQLIEGSQIKEYEPYCRGVKALLSPHTGIVDYGLVTRSMGDNVKARGGEVKLNYEVSKFQSAPEDGRLLIFAKDGRSVSCKGAIVCGGLQSDRLAVLSNCKPTPKIVPFRGDYLRLKPEKRHLVRGNIYPVPDARFPFLGVHFTPRMNGDLWLGPTAVLSFAREGYGMFSFNLRDTWEELTFPGLIKLGGRFLRFGLGEMWRNIYTPAQVKLLQRYIPEISAKDVERTHAGNRAQAIDSNGDMVDDFIIDTAQDEMGKKIVHVRNAPSPAATSSLAIANHIVNTVKEKFEFMK
ncbi:L-2-hydroxyglutarate dehydrogenase, mitochondrial [Hypsibius exemplaris]|uniref:L-2-hydroxyglutarate dehydrogenase, mitochondrial n=1 Tax=Hypsibius exemplaris TaxID=2072580 RepID=A0A9X6NKB8_HYPEX|nr:L-2-hydroxyglutarate dehydrogenase, mitochondrial [Hypsibius exemplaris]